MMLLFDVFCFVVWLLTLSSGFAILTDSWPPKPLPGEKEHAPCTPKEKLALLIFFLCGLLFTQIVMHINIALSDYKSGVDTEYTVWVRKELSFLRDIFK